MFIIKGVFISITIVLLFLYFQSAYLQDKLAPIAIDDILLNNDDSGKKEKQKILVVKDKGTLENVYKIIWDATTGMIQQGRVPEPLQNRRQYAVSIVAELSFLNSEMGEKLEAIASNLKSVCPSLSVLSKELLHFTLFVIVYDIPLAEITEQTPRLDIQMVNTVSNIFNSIDLVTVQFEGVNLGPDGGVFVQGHVQEDTIFELRNKLSDEFPDEKRRSPLVHMTLGRIASPVDIEEFKKLYDEIEGLRNMDFGRVDVRCARIIADTDRFGTDREDKSYLVYRKSSGRRIIYQLKIPPRDSTSGSN